ncbi:MAG: pantetheine-phosphate adenylyltransferase [Alphaproteobacteria bacterium]|nr:pantetheine-phosphate adenylyltransferase [Alphaproteobacteria bacterium]
MSKRIGVYPGTFDPITLGHLNLVERAANLVDELIIGVALNTHKHSLFTVEERIEMVKQEIKKFQDKHTIIVKPLVDTLLVNFAKENNAQMIFRGLRAVSDFEYEFKMCVTNRRLDENIETVFLMASEKHQFVASEFVKEICKLGGDISTFVTKNVADKLITRFKEVGEIK